MKTEKSHLHLTLWQHCQQVSSSLTPQQNQHSLVGANLGTGGRGEASQAPYLVLCEDWKVHEKLPDGTRWEKYPFGIIFTFLQGRTVDGVSPLIPSAAEGSQ